MVATIAEKSLAIVAIAEIDFSSISAIVAIIWKPLSRDCSDRCDEKYTRMQYVAVFSRSSRAFFLFCNDRSDHMETCSRKGRSTLL